MPLSKQPTSSEMTIPDWSDVESEFNEEFLKLEERFTQPTVANRVQSSHSDFAVTSKTETSVVIDSKTKNARTTITQMNKNQREFWHYIDDSPGIVPLAKQEKIITLGEVDGCKVGRIKHRLVALLRPLQTADIFPKLEDMNTPKSWCSLSPMPSVLPKYQAMLIESIVSHNGIEFRLMNRHFRDVKNAGNLQSVHNFQGHIYALLSKPELKLLAWQPKKFYTEILASSSFPKEGESTDWYYVENKLERIAPKDRNKCREIRHINGYEICHINNRTVARFDTFFAFFLQHAGSIFNGKEKCGHFKSWCIISNENARPLPLYQAILVEKIDEICRGTEYGSLNISKPAIKVAKLSYRAMSRRNERSKQQMQWYYISNGTGTVPSGRVNRIIRLKQERGTEYGILCDEKLGICHVARLKKKSYEERLRKQDQVKKWYFTDTLEKVLYPECNSIAETRISMNTQYGIIQQIDPDGEHHTRDVVLLSQGALERRHASRKATLKWYYLIDNTEVPEKEIAKIEETKPVNGIKMGLLENLFKVGLYTLKSIENRRKSKEKIWFYVGGGVCGRVAKSQMKDICHNLDDNGTTASHTLDGVPVAKMTPNEYRQLQSKDPSLMSSYTVHKELLNQRRKTSRERQYKERNNKIADSFLNLSASSTPTPGVKHRKKIKL